MNTSQAQSETQTIKKTKSGNSFVSKAFWGLIGLLAIAAVGLIAMASMALKEHTYVDTDVAKKVDPSVEIIEVGGQSRMVNGSLVPTNPLGEDEGLVNPGTSNTAEKELAEGKNEGSKLVEAVSPVEPIKKVEVAASTKPQVEQVAKAEAVQPKAEKSVQNKEANAQMDNLF